MRADRPIPGEPWPHDMLLTVTTDSDVLLQLLWIRQAFDLQPPGDGWPPLLPDLDARAGVEPEPDESKRTASADSWGRLWRSATEHAGNRPSPDLVEAARTASTPERRAELIAAFHGPSWMDEHDDDGFGEPYTAWREDLLRALIAEQHLALEQTPERGSLPALIAAWRKGLATIVTIPVPGTHTRTLGRHGLLTTAETRADPVRYTEALRAFDPH